MFIQICISSVGVAKMWGELRIRVASVGGFGS